MEMLDWRSVGAADAAALAVLGFAVARGLWIGMIREAFSLASIAAACVAVRLATAPAAAFLIANGPGNLSPLVARIGAALFVVVATLVGVRLAGRLLRRGVRAVGLGFVDRLGGAALGAAEGVLVLALVLLLGITAIGRDHPALASSHAVRIFDAARAWAGLAPKPAPQVAAPPPER